jgi:hypothetical protein
VDIGADLGCLDLVVYAATCALKMRFIKRTEAEQLQITFLTFDYTPVLSLRTHPKNNGGIASTSQRAKQSPNDQIYPI